MALERIPEKVKSDAYTIQIKVKYDFENQKCSQTFIIAIKRVEISTKVFVYVCSFDVFFFFEIHI